MEEELKAEEAYLQCESMLEQLKNDTQEEILYGDIKDQADSLAEEEFLAELVEEEVWQHLNPVQAFEEYHEILERDYGIIEDKAVYEWMDLKMQEQIDDDAPIPTEEQCTY